jgi:2-dehydro-3-deoxygalactonokinase
MTALIGIDWGSSNLRAFRIGQDGAILEIRRAADGVFTASGSFDERLRAVIGDWPPAPVLLCGMVGSDRGWHPAPYVKTPAGIANLAGGLIAVPFERQAFIVPGVAADSDVMRGEETLVAGLPPLSATLCLPGTHSKWIVVADGRIAAFRTYMTGELRAALLAQGALATGIGQIASPVAFAQGLDAASQGVTHALFQARARRLLGRLAAEHTASFVSGVLIGAERAAESDHPGPHILVARGTLAGDYAAAFDFTQIIDPEPLAARGLLAIARAAGLVA